MAEYAHNSRVHSSTGLSPFVVNTGRNPIEPMSQKRSYTIPGAADMSRTMCTIWKYCHQSIVRATRDMKRFADRKRQHMVFVPNEKVWLDAKHLNLKLPSEKLSPRRVGPLKVVERIGETAYRLKLPDSWGKRIHPVFHVSRLYPCKEDIDLEEEPIEVDEEETSPESIVESRMKKDRFEYLIKWKDLPESENSWEPAEEYRRTPLAMEFHRKHPSAPRHADDLRMKLRFQEIDHPDPRCFSSRLEDST